MSYAEIKGSRETTAGGKVTTGVILGVSDNGAGGAAAAAYYTGDSGETGKVCVLAKVTPEIIPGIWLHTDQYQGFVAYS